MNSRLIPYSSLFRLISVIKNNGGIHYSRVQRLAPYLTRILLFEPICWLESVALENKIKNHQLTEAPLFVLGHWRSGTTFLQRLLCEDHRFGYHNIYKAVLPQMYFSTEKIFTPFFQVVNDTINAKNPFHRVRLVWSAADEDDTAFLGMLSPRTPYWGQVMPKNHQGSLSKYIFNNYESTDLEKWKADYLYIIKKLSLYYNKPLILRTPPNTGRVKQLLELFPNAKFIYIHRNPYDVYNSNLGLWEANLKNFCFQKPSKEDVKERILFGYEQIISNYISQRNLIPKNNLIEIRYEDLYTNTIENMEQIYNALSLPDFGEIKPRLENFVAKNKQKEKTEYAYSEDMITTVNQRWSFSLNEWPY